MTIDLDQARDRLIDQVLDATTLPQIKAAQQALRDWIRDHPNEQGMRDGFEQLSLMEDIARMGAAGLLVKEPPPDLATCDVGEGRKWVINQVAQAVTLPEIAAARAALTKWLQVHPEDDLQCDLAPLTLMLDCAQQHEAARLRSVPANARQAA